MSTVHNFRGCRTQNLLGEGIASGLRSVTFDVALRAWFDGVVTHAAVRINGRALARKTPYATGALS